MASPPPPATTLSYPKLLSFSAPRAAGEVGRGESRRDWGRLIPELLRLVLSQLPLRDLIRSALACKAWRQAASEVHQPQQPWFGVMDTRQFYSISDRRFYTLPSLPNDLASHHLGGTHHGTWLLLVPPRHLGEHADPCCCLYNPFTTRRISIPPPTGRYDELYLILSSSPSDPNCVAFICLHINNCTPAVNAIGVFCLHGAEREWKSIPCRPGVRDITFFNGSLYAITGAGALSSVNTESSEVRCLIPPPTGLLLPLWLQQSSHRLKRSRISYRLLVFEGQLMMVCFVPKWGLVPFAVFKADFELKAWEAVDSLGGQAIFCDNAGGFTPMRPMKSLGIEGDCIYSLGFRYHMLFRISKQGLPDCFEDLTMPHIWRHMLDGRSYHCFLTPKPNFGNPD